MVDRASVALGAISGVVLAFVGDGVPPTTGLSRWERGRGGQALAGGMVRDAELLLVPAAGASDPGRADLALLAHGATQRAEVLVIDHVDLVTAELAWLAPAASRWALLVTPARCLLPTTCFCHANSLLPVRSQNGMSSSPEPPAGALT